MAEGAGVVGAGGGGEGDGEDDEDGGEGNHDAGGGAVAEAEAGAEGIAEVGEERPGGEDKDGAPKDGGEEGEEDDGTADGEAHGEGCRHRSLRLCALVTAGSRHWWLAMEPRYHRAGRGATVTAGRGWRRP